MNTCIVCTWKLELFPNGPHLWEFATIWHFFGKKPQKWEGIINKGSSRRRDKDADKSGRLTGKYYDSGLIFSLRTPIHPISIISQLDTTVQVRPTKREEEIERAMVVILLLQGDTPHGEKVANVLNATTSIWVAYFWVPDPPNLSDNLPPKRRL